MKGKQTQAVMAHSCDLMRRSGVAIALRKQNGYRANLMCIEIRSLVATVWETRP